MSRHGSNIFFAIFSGASGAFASRRSPAFRCRCLLGPAGRGHRNGDEAGEEWTLRGWRFLGTFSWDFHGSEWGILWDLGEIFDVGFVDINFGISWDSMRVEYGISNHFHAAILYRFQCIFFEFIWFHMNSWDITQMKFRGNWVETGLSSRFWWCWEHIAEIMW